MNWTRISEPYKLGFHLVVLCRCHCGTTRPIRIQPGGELRSKGCVKCSPRGRHKHNVKHGHTRNGKTTPTYRAWRSMRLRAKRGRRKLEPRWHSFVGFLQDLGEQPTRIAALRLRADDGDYVAGNLYWHDELTAYG